MIHLRKFNESLSISKEEVVDFLIKYTPFQQRKNPELRRGRIEISFTIKSDGLVEFYGISLDPALGLPIYDYPGLELPFKHNLIGPAIVTRCGIKNLKNFPDTCADITLMDCKNLTSLEGGPKSLNSLEIMSSHVGVAPINLYETGGWFAENLNLITIPDIQGTEVNFFNDITRYNDRRFENIKFSIPIFNILKLFCVKKNGITNFFESVKDYDYIRGNKVIKPLFEQTCREYDIRMPRKIESYTWLE